MSKDARNTSRAKRSYVWSVFRKVIVEGKEKAKCSLRERTFAYNGSTFSNLKDHIEWHKRTTALLNPGLGTSSAEKKQITVLDVFSPTDIWLCSVAQANGITDRLARWCWRNVRPINIIADEGLQDLVHFLEPGYEFPTPNHIANLIRLTYADAVENLTVILVPTSVIPVY